MADDAAAFCATLKAQLSDLLADETRRKSVLTWWIDSVNHFGDVSPVLFVHLLDVIAHGIQFLRALPRRDIVTEARMYGLVHLCVEGHSREFTTMITRVGEALRLQRQARSLLRTLKLLTTHTALRGATNVLKADMRPELESLRGQIARRQKDRVHAQVIRDTRLVSGLVLDFILALVSRFYVETHRAEAVQYISAL